MSHSRRSSLEVTQTLRHCAAASGFGFRQDTALVAVQHMLEQTLDLFRTICEMGLPPENIFALGKIYSNNQSVIEAIRSLGITVVKTTTPAPGGFHRTFENDVDKLWQIAAKELNRRKIKRVLVLDDGGVCICNVPTDVRRRYALGGVEQTSQGMFLFEEKPPSFAVMSWARSAVKLEIGGPIFSKCFMERFNTEFLGRRSSQKDRLGVVGMGSIGKAVAGLALRQIRTLFYYDPNIDLKLPVRLQRQAVRLGSLAELMLRSDYVIGCSGRKPFWRTWPLPYKPGLKLLSASGGDYEFAPIIADLKRSAGFRVLPESWDIVAPHGPSGSITIAYLGYPYNFVLRATESVPTEIVQLETGGLLVALIQADVYLNLCDEGLAENIGVHRISLAAQQLIYTRWLSAMSDRGIDIVERFGYEPELLRAARDDAWLAAHSEPRSNKQYLPSKTLEDRMRKIIFHKDGVSRW